MGKMDKKMCENCTHLGKIGCLGYVAPEPCVHWFRNPSLWLSIWPSEPGWYFQRRKNEPKYYTVRGIVESEEDGALVEIVGDHDDEITVVKIGGEWQGPIKPSEDK